MHRPSDDLLCWLVQKKELPKKSYEDKGASHVDEGPLDDPIAEKLRQQRQDLPSVTLKSSAGTSL
jgi:hypothetical protein